jgi:hypothetical protein
MIKFWFFLLAAFGLILFFQKCLISFRIWRLQKKIKRDPLIGIKQQDNNYYYTEKGYTLGYRISESSAGIKKVERVFLKRHLTFYENNILEIKRLLNKFFLYRRWGILLQPLVLGLLVSSVVIFYFGLVETQQVREDRLKFVVASIIGVKPDQIEYIGNGQLEISTSHRKTAVDSISEPVKYTFNPFMWFFSSQGGVISRWQSHEQRYINHPVVYNDRGDIWINNDGTWRSGKLTNNDKTIEWDQPQGSGIRAGKVTGHEISTQNKEITIFDK